MTAVEETAPTIANVERLAGWLDTQGLGTGDPLGHRYIFGGSQNEIYEVLAQWKLAVILEQAYQRADGDPKLEAFGPVILDLMAGAAALAENSDYRR